MNRKKFIESHGATCRNWNWSWSFINEAEKFIIFGAWDFHTNGNTSMILSETWEINIKGKKANGYKQSREHVRLIEEEGYALKTFPMVYSDANKDDDGAGPAKIKDFIPKLTTKSLKRVGKNWYASDDQLGDTLPEEVTTPELYKEGATNKVSINAYERNPDARLKCIEHYGYRCAICDFDFSDYYGDIGKNYIHVHHLVPLSEVKGEYELDPIKDLRPVCPNCHAMIHRTQPILSIEELKSHITNRSTTEAPKRRAR